MFKWLKALAGKSKVKPVPKSAPEVPRDKSLGVYDVVETFLRENPQHTPWPVHALIAAGVTRLESSRDVRSACDKIEAHGYQYPLSPTIRSVLGEGPHLLDFLRWQEANNIAVEEYEHEMKIRGLVERFEEERKR